MTAKSTTAEHGGRERPSDPDQRPVDPQRDVNAPPDAAGDDQAPYTYHYGHGRMPFFMKLVWLGFLVFAAWYVVEFLLVSLGEELGATG